MLGGPGRRPPIGLRWRASTWFIALMAANAIFMDICTYSLILPAIPFRLEAMRVSNVGAFTGLMAAAYGIGLIVSTPPVAYLGERFRARKLPLVASTLFSLAALLLFMLVESPAGMIVARVLQGFGGTFIWVIGFACVHDSVPERKLGRTLGVVFLGSNCGNIVGPVVGGTLYEHLGWTATFICAFALLGVDIVLRLVFIEKRVAQHWIEQGLYEIPNFESSEYENGKALSKSRDEISAKRGLVELFTSGRAIVDMLVSSLNGFTIVGLVQTHLTILLADLGYSSATCGYILISSIVPCLFASPAAGWLTDRFGPKYVTAAGLVVAVPATLVLLVYRSLSALVVTLVVLGTTQSFFLTPATGDLGLFSETIPSLGPAHVYGAFNIAYSIGASVGPFVTTATVSQLGTHKAWIVGCAINSAYAATLVLPVLVWTGGRKRQQRKEAESLEEEMKEEEAVTAPYEI